MDNETRNLSNYVREKGFKLSTIAKETNISYTSLYDSLANDSKGRDLRAGEFMAICKFLEKNPMDFAEEKEKK